MSAAATPRAGARSGVLTDLALGARMSVSGGRSGWLRLALIAVGVGVGVGLLLLVASLPTALDARQSRTEARAPVATESGPTDGTLLTDDVRSGFRDVGIQGRLLQPEGPDAPVPPGLDRLPAPGEVVLSPALERLMASPDGEALRGRWGERVVGTIGSEGLAGPGELTFYLGTDELTEETATRVSAFGSGAAGPGGTDPVFVVLAVVGLAVLLVPVVSFVGTAVRFGSEARDRRLAALRLVGADVPTTRRVAAGETLVGSLVGLAVGAVLLLVGRQVLPSLLPATLTLRAEDLRPVPLLAVLVAVAVPVASVLVTLSAMRRVVVEPLGVVRRATVTRRRLWWRVALLVLGAAALTAALARDGISGPTQALVAVGVVLVLVGVAALLPSVVDAVVRRLGGGGVAWELAVRRLQTESGTAVRAVSTIVVSVAGLVAVHGLVGGMTGEVQQAQEPRTAVFQAVLFADGGAGAPPQDWVDGLAGTEGVRDVEVSSSPAAHLAGSEEPVLLEVLTCPVAAFELGVTECSDGDAFLVSAEGEPVPEAGTEIVLAEPGSTGATWALPADVTRVPRPADAVQPAPGEALPPWIAVTPSALGDLDYDAGHSTVYIALDPAVPDAVDHLRTAAAQVQPTTYVASLEQESLVGALATVRQVLLAGTVLLLAVVGASLLVTVGEQLRERRRPLAVLVAFGTRRRTLGLSVLWQTAVPVALGLLLAVATGVGLSMTLQSTTGVVVGVDWGGVLAIAGGAAAVVLLTTAASLPLLTGLTRPAALHAE